MKGRAGDAWHARVNAFPMEQRLKVLSLVGFEGIYIDRRAYKPEEMAALDQELRNYLHEKAQISEDKNLCFYSMHKYNDAYLAQYSDAEKEQYRKELLREVYISEQRGISNIEKNQQGTWQWMDREALLVLRNEEEPYHQLAEFTIAAPASDAAILTIEVNGETHEYQIGRNPVHIACPVSIVHGENKIRLATDAKRIDSPKDIRNMYIRFVDSDITAFLPMFVNLK